MTFRKPRAGARAMVFVLVLAAVFGAAPASAQGPCAPRQRLAAALTGQYGEQPVARGNGDGFVIELFAAPSGAFSLLVSRPGGLSCIIAAGTAWRRVAAAAGAAQSPDGSRRWNP